MTSLLEQLQSDVKDAMRARDSDRVQSLRLFVNAVQNEAKGKQRDLEDPEVVSVLQREKKKRVEAAEAFEAAGHADRAVAEREQAAMLEGYLPEQLGEAELDELVRSAVAETGAEGPSAMGAVMKAVMPKVAGRADGKAVSAAVNRALRPG
ncbi:MAG: YqeY family protein [Thermoleophilia bacterium]|nr:YqeY family protein [Thermoleophilia bacterium]